MKKEPVLLTIALTLGSIASCGTTNLEGPVPDQKEFAKAEANAAPSFTMKEFTEFLQTKREHYPLSDEFIERYQQADGGYIDTAKKLGLLVDKEQHEPNQKWHFFTSWFEASLEDGTVTMESDPQTVVYNRLLCPELLLWIYEASGVEPTKVKMAKEVAEQGKVSKTRVSTIAKNMRAQVPWDDISRNVSAYLEGV